MNDFTLKDKRTSINFHKSEGTPHSRLMTLTCPLNGIIIKSSKQVYILLHTL